MGLPSAVAWIQPRVQLEDPAGEPPTEVCWHPYSHREGDSWEFFICLKPFRVLPWHPLAVFESLVSETCLLTQTLTFPDWDRQIGIATFLWFFSSLVISGSLLKWGYRGLLSYSKVGRQCRRTCVLVFMLRLRASLANKMPMFFICKEREMRRLGVWLTWYA